MPAVLRRGLGKCTASKGGRLARSPFPKTRQAARGNTHESRRPADGSAAKRSQVQLDRVLSRDTLSRELLLLFSKAPGARIRRPGSKRDRDRPPNVQDLEFRLLRGGNCSKETARAILWQEYRLL